MVWEQNVERIIMLVNFYEKDGQGGIKYEDYLPERNVNTNFNSHSLDSEIYGEISNSVVRKPNHKI